MNLSKCVSLWVTDSDLRNGYFVLTDLLTKLPKDTIITHSWPSYSSGHIVFTLCSEEFPLTIENTAIPRAEFKYNSTDGLHIEWPSKDYEDIALKLLNNKIAEDLVNNSVSVPPEFEKVFKDNMQKLLWTDESESTVCKHEWFMYGRTAATKQCKKCGIVKENT